MSEGERRLAAIMYTDIVGYTSLTQKDEASTLQLLENHRRLLRPHFTSHGGREIKTIGDAFLVEFQSALDAVLCAVAIQQMMHDRKVARGEPLSLRIGIHVGDVVEIGGDILGDAVNIASRIEPLAEPGGICISSQVYDQVRNKSDLPFDALGQKSLKNVAVPISVYSIRMPWERPAAPEAVAHPTNRIAVLPFVSMSTDPNDVFFADGMTEEIISTVSGISGLKVISRTSVMHYKTTEKTVGEIGRELKVGSVLEGSFRKAGNRIRVTTQLINVADDEHLWAQNYDRNLDDIFAVQSDVAKQVAEALRVKILAPEKERIERPPTESTAAYTLYLKGRHLWNMRGLGAVRSAAECFEQAVREDPNFALGYVGQADCCLIIRNNWGFDTEANLAKAKTTVARALELDPGLAEAHATRGLMLLQEYDTRGAEDELKRAIQLKPSYAMAHMWYYLLLFDEVRWEEAKEQIEKAVEFDPLSPIINSNYGGFYFATGQYGKAMELFERVIALDPSNPGWHGSVGTLYGKLKKFDDMKKEYAITAEFLRGTYPLVRLYYEAFAAYWEDDKETMRRLLPEIEAHGREAGCDAYTIAVGYFFLGETDRGFEWLEKSYAWKEGSLLGIKSESAMDSLRDDPRYLDLLKRLGLGQP